MTTIAPQRIPVRCSRCDGKGAILTREDRGRGTKVSRICDHCAGNGWRYED